MAKEPETVDRIQIIADAPTLELVGPGLAALTKLGFTNVGYKLTTDILNYKNRKTHEVSATEFAFAFVQANARFKIADLVAHFSQAGREPRAAYYVAGRLEARNVVRKNGNGYVRVEALPAPLKTRRGGSNKPYDVPNKTLIARAIKGRKHITLDELRALFAKEKRPAKSVSPIVGAMVKAKRLKRLGDGKYDILPMNGAAADG